MVFPGGVGSWPVLYKCIRNDIFLCWNSSDLSKSILDSALMMGGSVQAGENLSVSVGILSRVSIRLTKKASRLLAWLIHARVCLRMM